MSLSPSRKSSSMFSICVPAFLRWELHQAVKVWGSRGEHGLEGRRVRQGSPAKGPGHSPDPATARLPRGPCSGPGPGPHLLSTMTLFLVFTATQAGGSEDTEAQGSYQTTTWSAR